MKASASLLLCDEKRYPTFAAQLEAIRAQGFTAVDVGAFTRWGKGLSTTRLTTEPDYFHECVQGIRRSGLEAPTINCGPEPELLRGGPDEVERYAREVQTVVRLAGQIGARRITTQVPQPPETWAPDRIEREYVARWLRILERVKPPRDIIFGVEAHAQTFLEEPQVALRVVSRLAPAVGVTYDPSHQVMIGVPLEDTLPLLQYCNQVHIRDARRGRMQCRYGEGEIDVVWVLRHLHEAGYDGPVTVEYFEDEDPDFDSARRLKAVIEGFRPARDRADRFGGGR